MFPLVRQAVLYCLQIKFSGEVLQQLFNSAALEEKILFEGKRRLPYEWKYIYILVELVGISSTIVDQL
jgi:hypothetical protein